MNSKSSIPKILWIAVISLAVFGIFHFILGLTNPVQFIAFAINVILIIGLLRLAKWAWVLSILTSILAPILLLMRGDAYFYFILIVNLTVLIPVLLTTKFFFQNENRP